MRTSLARIGVDARVRLVDEVQYQRRRQNFDFDMMIGSWLASASPGSEERTRWGSEAASEPASYNLAGVESPAVDAVVDSLLAAQSQDDFVMSVRALDRVLLSGFYIVPLYHARNQWIATSTTLARPAKLPAYGSPTLDDTLIPGGGRSREHCPTSRSLWPRGARALTPHRSRHARDGRSAATAGWPRLCRSSGTLASRNRRRASLGPCAHPRRMRSATRRAHFLIVGGAEVSVAIAATAASAWRFRARAGTDRSRRQGRSPPMGRRLMRSHCRADQLWRPRLF